MKRNKQKTRIYHTKVGLDVKLLVNFKYSYSIRYVQYDCIYTLYISIRREDGAAFLHTEISNMAGRTLFYIDYKSSGWRRLT